jgi:hypothetical protein
MAPNELWDKISGHENGDGSICLMCFEALAKKKGIWLRWKCEDIGIPWRE